MDFNNNKFVFIIDFVNKCSLFIKNNLTICVILLIIDILLIILGIVSNNTAFNIVSTIITIDITGLGLKNIYESILNSNKNIYKFKKDIIKKLIENLISKHDKRFFNITKYNSCNENSQDENKLNTSLIQHCILCQEYYNDLAKYIKEDLNIVIEVLNSKLNKRKEFKYKNLIYYIKSNIPNNSFCNFFTDTCICEFCKFYRKYTQMDQINIILTIQV